MKSRSKRAHGDGGIDSRGENVHRLRYRVGGKRFTKTFHGTLPEARKELRTLISTGDAGKHVAPDKMTVGQWIDEWIAVGAPGRKKKRVSERTLERYSDLLRVHVKPVLGGRRLQALRATEIDKLYADMSTAKKIAPRTQHHVHTVFSAALSTATRKKMLVVNPMDAVEQVPAVTHYEPEDHPDIDPDDIGEGLTDVELAALISGFRSSTIFPIVALAAATGARRNELLALRWTDLDVAEGTLRIERAWERTKKHGLRLKPPKTKRGLRTIDIDEATVSLLLKEREVHQRLCAGLPDGVGVDLSLIKLPSNALMFPNPAGPSEAPAFTAPRLPGSVTQAFARRAEALGFGNIRFHDLRGIHSTALLDDGVPVHTVAQRIGDDPATLLRSYTKRRRSKRADAKLSAAIAGFASGFLKP